jgi:RNA polymerase sigma-70 factor (ECF subfamily)
MRASLSRPDTANRSEQAERTDEFRRLAEQDLDPSFRLANAILGDPAEAEDAVQDAFVTAWRKWDSLRDTTKAVAWFKRIVVNTCRDRLRHQARRRTDDLALHGSLATPDTSAAVDERVLLEQALRRLEADDQVLIVLRYDHDLVLDDIAHLLDTPVGTVKWRLNRAHQRLRTALEQAGGSSR